jgi:hypothetical protein
MGWTIKAQIVFSLTGGVMAALRSIMTGLSVILHDFSLAATLRFKTKTVRLWCRGGVNYASSLPSLKDDLLRVFTLEIRCPVVHPERV